MCLSLAKLAQGPGWTSGGNIMRNLTSHHCHDKSKEEGNPRRFQWDIFKCNQVDIKIISNIVHTLQFALLK